MMAHPFLIKLIRVQSSKAPEKLIFMYFYQLRLASISSFFVYLVNLVDSEKLCHLLTL